MKTRRIGWSRIGWIKSAGQLKLAQLALAMVVSLGLSVVLSACENVASYTQPSLVRVIDASYIAPAADVTVEGQLIAGNIGLGSISAYGTVPASNAAIVKVTASTGGATLVSSSSALPVGHQQSVFLTDNSSAAAGYQVTVLEDQNVPAPSGHSAFRFLNQATKTGAVDIYMIPSSTTLAKSIPLYSALPAGGSTGYIDFPSQAVTMVITPTGVITPMYASSPIALTGGEVETVLILDSQLTSNAPIEVFSANDFN